uniref:Gamma-glutamylcyclotransferase AIG2-like domain-containing protein n=1 Tax=Magnetococcus massalia (strain MO-1) TaxID=451514 RepID=A0A1S7LJN1_MAGMO|nr:conserved exported protein of unknown function [Candidatus Magnetococcus massalia]
MVLRHFFTLFLFLLLFSPHPLIADSYWQQKLPDQPMDFIFGYGSLMNSESRKSTAGRMTVAIPVRISAAFGYRRAWVFRAGSMGFTALGLEKETPQAPASTINGVIYPVNDQELAAFDKRESGYDRVAVPLEQIEAVGWLPLPKQGRFWLYLPKVSTLAKRGAHRASASHPLVQSYIDLCVRGALEHGEAFAEEFLQTTYGWSRWWLNDRQQPRRPWVHQKWFRSVDKLLKRFPQDEARRTYAQRKRPVEFAMQRMTEGRDRKFHAE